MRITIRSAAAWVLGAGMAFGVASPVGAQSAGVSATASMSVSARAVAAIEVPHAAIELRSAGVPEPEVRTALVAVHHHHVPAPEVHMMLTHSVRHVHVHGPIPNFGHFVEVKIGKGFRGPRLYKSIRIEHEHRGHGPPPHAKGLAKGHRRHGHPGHGPPGLRGKGGVKVHVEGKHHGPKGRVRVGGKPHGPKGRVRVRAKPGKPKGNVRVRGGGSVRVRGGGGHGRGGGGRGGRGRGKH